MPVFTFFNNNLSPTPTTSLTTILPVARGAVAPKSSAAYSIDGHGEFTIERRWDGNKALLVVEDTEGTIRGSF